MMQRKRDKLGKDYKLKTYSYDQFPLLLETDECDAFYIATPNNMHRKFAVPALEHGYHVLLEKPMEVSVEDCQAILDAQTKSGAKLMIAYRLHHEPGTLDVIDRVRKGDFGDPRIFSSVFTQDLKPENHRAKHGFRCRSDSRPGCLSDQCCTKHLWTGTLRSDRCRFQDTRPRLPKNGSWHDQCDPSISWWSCRNVCL